MWDFSWLERRWSGAGYEDWARALDELALRGYNAVRIDAYPHLVSVDPKREWTLEPVWNQQDWGSPATTRVRVQPALNEFLAFCAERGIAVGLSSWFRKDTEDTRLRIGSPEKLAEAWLRTLDGIEDAGLLDTILYVDLCNEWPMPVWAPYFTQALGLGQVEDPSVLMAHLPEVLRWMQESISVMREARANLPYCFSFIYGSGLQDVLAEMDVSYMDLLEPHVWMAQWSEFYDEVGYRYELFESTGYDNLARDGEALYRARPDHWRARLRAGVESAAAWSRATGKPLVTTECWSVVDYKDWPQLDWGWVKELCEFGVEQASASGRWTAIATSNFCGPQFVGMWRDVGWHQRLTGSIKSAPIDVDLHDSLVTRRIATG